ncbi:MAG: AI-2E family transporter [Candidatus Eremiobacteraeota bacterium]|nr:AI-2E family transporter [Candidatus Eremiobacteraeota bacterium]
MPDRPKVWSWFTEAHVTYWLKVLLLVVLALYLLGGIFAFLARIQGIAIVVIASIFFAYLIYPIVRVLNRRLPLVLAVLIVYAALILIVGLTLAFIVPPLSYDISQVVQNYPHAIAYVQSEIANPSTPFFSRLPDWLRHMLANLPEGTAIWIRTHGGDAMRSLITVVTGTATIVAAFVIVPILAAYLLLDSENIKRHFIALIPDRRRERSLEVLAELEQVIGGFIRGQILVGLSVGILITIMLLVLHVQYAVLIGVAAAVLDLIPYVGAVVTFIPAVAIALFTNGPANAAIVAILFILIFEMEGHLIAPNIVSKTVALSPLTVLLALLIGAELMGIVGMFLAVPVAGMLRVLTFHVIPPKASVQEAQPGLTEAAREDTVGLESVGEKVE